MSTLKLLGSDLVDVAFPELDQVHRLENPGVVLREDVGGEAILGIVRVLNRPIKTIHAQHRNDWTKYLVLNQRRFLTDILNDGRLVEPAFGATMRLFSSNDHFPSFLSGLLDKLGTNLSLLLAHHRAEISLATRWVTNPKLPSHFHEGRKESFLDLIVEVDSL